MFLVSDIRSVPLLAGDGSLSLKCHCLIALIFFPGKTLPQNGVTMLSGVELWSTNYTNADASEWQPQCRAQVLRNRFRLDGNSKGHLYAEFLTHFYSV